MAEEARHFVSEEEARWGRELPAPFLDGRTLASLGVPRGPRMGRILRRLRFAQYAGEIENEAEARNWVEAQRCSAPAPDGRSDQEPS